DRTSHAWAHKATARRRGARRAPARAAAQAEDRLRASDARVADPRRASPLARLACVGRSRARSRRYSRCRRRPQSARGFPARQIALHEAVEHYRLRKLVSGVLKLPGLIPPNPPSPCWEKGG